MLQTRSQFGALVKGVKARLSEVFDEAALVYKVEVPAFLKKKPSEDAQYNASGVTGAGKLSKRTEGANYPVNRLYKLYDTTFVHTTYSGSLEVSMEQIQDRDFESIFDETRQLTIAGYRWMQQAMFQPFVGGFGTSDAVNGFDLTRYGDSKALFSTAHPRLDGGSNQSNASATGITLTDDNLETGRIALYMQLLDDGSPISIVGKVFLVVATNLEKTGKIITGSSLRSGTANNDMNIYNDGVMGLVSTHYLSSTHGGSNTQWQLVSEDVSRINFIERLAPSIDIKDTEAGGIKATIDVRLSIGHSHWVGSWGSKGDGAAYSG